MGGWKKEFQSILSRLKREPGYVYFKVSVDPVELHIPLYPYLIKHPMDLGTVEAKLSSGAYESQVPAATDILTCFNNALLFNGPASTSSDVYKSAKSMRAAFVKLYRSKFGSDPPHVGFDVLAPDFLPEEERVELTKPNVAILIDMLSRLRKKYEKALEPFVYCVDPERYPDYYKKITNPVALSVVEAKLELHGYEMFGHFAAETRSIWSNCQLYNGQDKLSRQAGKIATKFEKYLAKALADMRSIVVIDDGPAKKAATKVVLPVSLPVDISAEPAAAVEILPLPPVAESTPPVSEEIPVPIEKERDKIAAAPQEIKREQSITLKLALPSRPPFNKAVCLNIINKLIKDKRSQLFRDPVPGTVPGYRDVIHRPMDLKTIRANIQAGCYENNDDFVADVAQIWENCRTFNGPSPITDLANVLATKFERDFLPLLDAEHQPAIQPSKPPAPPQKPKLPKVQPTGSEMPVKLEPAVSPAYSGPILPSIPIPPTAADASLICIPSQPMTRTSSRLCSTILRSVISLDMSGDFMDPLDPAMYNYVGYDDYVKKRMDLKTVRKNLDTDRYPTPNEFLADLNLVFLNALTYPGTPLLTKIAARYLYLHIETCFLEAFPGANSKQNLKQPWVQAARTALNEVSSYDFGRLFAEPVNPIVFNLLEYYDRIEKPRDLLSVSTRFNAGIYNTASEFLADVDLIWSNCMFYHGDANPDLTDVAVNCRTVFLESFDRALSGVSTSESTSTELTSLPPVTAESTVAPPKPPAKRPAPTPAVHLIRRLKKMDTQQVFHFPVDQTLYPEYKNFVEKPMDLGTIESKLLEGGYTKAEDYVADVRLVFLNCAAYNAEGTPIRTLGNRLSGVFETHLEKTDIQASLDEIRSKLEQKREEKLRREKEKEEKQKVALQQKAAKQASESAKRKAESDGHGPVQKLAKTDHNKARRALPPLPNAVSDELVFKTLPPRIPMPLSVRKRLLPLICSQISALKLVPKSMPSSNSNDGPKSAEADKRNEETALVHPRGSNGIKFRLGAKTKTKPRPHKEVNASRAAPVFSTPIDADDAMDIDAYSEWDSKVQSWLQNMQTKSNPSLDCWAR